MWWQRKAFQTVLLAQSLMANSELARIGDCHGEETLSYLVAYIRCPASLNAPASFSCRRFWILLSLRTSDRKNEADSDGQ